MNASTSSLGLQAFACLAFAAMAVALHLKWHPQRAALSDAWDLLGRLQWLVLALASLKLMAAVTAFSTPDPPWSLGLILDWRELALPLARECLHDYAQLLHALPPPWPLACIAPLALICATLRLWRHPYRFGHHRLSTPQKTLLITLTAASLVWLALEAAHALQSLPAALEATRLALRIVNGALAIAVAQIFLIRLAVEWDQPAQLDQEHDPLRALESVLARWQPVLALAAFDALWLAWAAVDPARAGGWFMAEALLAFATLPCAVACAVPDSPLLGIAASAMRALIAAFWPWMSVLATSLFVLLLVHYADHLAAAWANPGSLAAKLLLPIRALVLATVDSWLLLATVFVLFRHGLHSAAPHGAVD
jgi:hypothetical protein